MKLGKLYDFNSRAEISAFPNMKPGFCTIPDPRAENAGFPGMRRAKKLPWANHGPAV